MMKITEQEQKQLELNSLIEFSQLINSNLNLEFILGNILLSIMGKMLITRGMILIKDHNNLAGNVYIIKAAKGIQIRNKNAKIIADFPGHSIFTISDIKNPDNYFIINKICFFYKIFFDRKLLGLLCIGNKAKNEGLTKRETIFIETLLNISASSIENTIRFEEINKLNINLDKKLTQLKSLFELSKEFYTNFIEKNKIIKLLHYTLLGNYGIKDLLIYTRFRSEEFYPINISSLTKNLKFNLREFENIRNIHFLTKDDKSDLLRYLYENNFELIIPIKKNNKLETVVCLGKRLNLQTYTDSDIEFLESIVNLTVLSLENSILLEEYIEKQKMEDELKIAREIQIGLFPKKLPEIKCYQTSAINIPALQICGDYYDLIKIAEDRYAFVIADVSGKGAPASLLMSNLQSAVHSSLKFYNEVDFKLENVTLKINELIYENTNPEKFITFFWGILDTTNNKFTYLNAGHNFPVLYSKNKFTYLDKGGFMLGISNSNICYETGDITLSGDDILLFYTDGVTEALNSENEEFGEDRLRSIIHESKTNSTDEIVAKIANSIQDFSKGVKQHDDITLIVLKRNR